MGTDIWDTTDATPRFPQQTSPGEELNEKDDLMNNYHDESDKYVVMHDVKEKKIEKETVEKTGEAKDSQPQPAQPASKSGDSDDRDKNAALSLTAFPLYITNLISVLTFVIVTKGMPNVLT